MWRAADSAALRYMYVEAPYELLLAEAPRVTHKLYWHGTVDDRLTVIYLYCTKYVYRMLANTVLLIIRRLYVDRNR